MLGERSDQWGLWEADRLYLDHVGKDTFYGLLALSMAPRNWATGAPESCTTCPMTGGRRQVE